MKNNKNNLDNFTINNGIVSDRFLHEPVLKNLLTFSDTKSTARFASSCKGLNTFFKSHLAAEEAIPLLTCVAYGKLAEAEAIVAAKPVLLLRKSKVADYSDRVFEDITAFQLALWYLDRRMWTMLKKYLPEKDAKDQLYEHLYLPTKYKKAHGDCFDFDILIEPLDVYVEKFDTLTKGERIAQWCLEVGDAQTKIPAHVVQEYCYPLLCLNKTRTFEESEVAARGHIYDLEKAGFKNDHHYMQYTFRHPPKSHHFVSIPWFPLSSTNPLGKEVGITRQDYYCSADTPPAIGCKWVIKERAQKDLDAIRQLSATRKKELENLKEKLLFSYLSPCRLI